MSWPLRVVQKVSELLAQRLVVAFGVFVALSAAIMPAAAVPPANDNFADAILLGGLSGSVSVTITDATFEAGEPSFQYCLRRSAWYKWVAPASGQLFVSAGGSAEAGFSCSHVHVGCSVGALAPVRGRYLLEFGSIHARVFQDTVEVEAGQTYYIQTAAADGVFAPNPTSHFTYEFTQPARKTVAAVLPSARSVTVGSPASAFGVLINTGADTLVGCLMALPATVPAGFSFRATDSAHDFIAPADSAVSVAPGAVQHFVFAVTPTAPIASQELSLIFDCKDSAISSSTVGLNTLLLTASTTPSPDLITTSVTTTGDGIVTIPGSGGTHIFATATVNIGAPGTVTATVDDNGHSLPLQITLCQTNPVTGACFNPSTPGPTAIVTLASNQVATFTAFIRAEGTVPFDPAVNRLTMRFKTADGQTRGATNVAVRTVP